MLREEIQAPEGWVWHGSNNVLMLSIPILELTNEEDIWQNACLTFFSWMEENDLKAIGYDRQSFSLLIEGQNQNLSYVVPAYYSFEIYRSEEEWPYGEDSKIQDTKFNCATCGHEERRISSLFCHNENCDALFYCTTCRKFRDAAHFDITGNITNCSLCGVACECGRFHSGYMEKCATCAPIFFCWNCSGYSTIETTPVIEGSEILCCEFCYSIYCVDCETFTSETMIDSNNRTCVRCRLIGKDGDKEIFDDRDNMAATKLTLPTIPGREMIRLSGVEIEGGKGKIRRNPENGLSGPNSLARSLYDTGLSMSYQQEGYHHGRGFARIETDASCDWECVIGPINMADYEDVKKLNNVVKLIKEHIKSDLLKLDLRCGTHIHIGADKISLAQAYNLHLLYTYMEDPLYRLGAANWPIHRIMINDETHSAQRSPKQLTKTRFARTFHNNRYYGLSFSNYFEKMLGECHCGAAEYGAFEECTCDLSKCTFEFRLFNSTANAIKLHAYLSLCQALVAKAISMPDIKDPTMFEEFPFETSRYRDWNGEKQRNMIAHWDERLRYIANDLPLTRDEKKSIYYCIKNSELAKVDGMKELFTEREAD